MNVEELRLLTLSNWPEDSPVEAEHVARGGFYATRNPDSRLEVQVCNVFIFYTNFRDNYFKILFDL